MTATPPVARLIQESPTITRRTRQSVCHADLTGSAVTPLATIGSGVSDMCKSASALVWNSGVGSIHDASNLLATAMTVPSASAAEVRNS